MHTGAYLLLEVSFVARLWMLGHFLLKFIRCWKKMNKLFSFVKLNLRNRTVIIQREMSVFPADS